jgi:hypothetical protein
MSLTLSNLSVSSVSAGTGGSTPPPSGDPYWSSVSLLTETTGTNTQNNSVFLDSSSNSFTVSNTFTNVMQGTFSPVSGGHSGYFAGDYHRLQTSNFSYANGDFTIETWVYPLSTSTNMTIFAQSDAGSNNTGAFRIESDNRLTYTYYTSASGGSAVAFQGGTISPNVWTHVAISRSGSTTKLFVNGAVVNTATIPTMYQSSSGTAIGSYYSTNVAAYNGYMSDLRVTTTAVYTNSFSVPTAPLTAIAGTQLLLSFNNAGIYDAAAKNDLYTVANTQVSTAQAKFGTTSTKFNGTGDFLNLPSNSSLQLGSGDFTVEGWVYPTTTASGEVFFLSGDAGGSSFAAVRLIMNTTLQLFMANSVGGWAVNNASGGTVTANNWYFVAITRSGNSVRMFLNGVQVGGTQTVTGSLMSGTLNYLGALNYSGYGGDSEFFNGYMQDVRITKGVARYTADFTPPTAPFPTN